MTDTATCQLLGVVAADAPSPEGTGAEVSLIPHRRIAGLGRPVPEQARVRRQDLLDYTRVLDAAAQHGPVIPVRFGTIVGSEEDILGQLLEPHHDTLAATLDSFRDTAQFTVRARYVEAELMREVLAEEPRVRRLHEQLGSGPANQAGRVRLGELVAGAVASRRQADAGALSEAVRRHVSATTVRLPRAVGGDQLADASYLVPLPRRDAFEQALEQLARQWHGRVRLRLLGPMAPYDFVAGPTEALVGRG